MAAEAAAAAALVTAAVWVAAVALAAASEAALEVAVISVVAVMALFVVVREVAVTGLRVAAALALMAAPTKALSKHVGFADHANTDVATALSVLMVKAISCSESRCVWAAEGAGIYSRPVLTLASVERFPGPRSASAAAHQNTACTRALSLLRQAARCLLPVALFARRAGTSRVTARLTPAVSTRVAALARYAAPPSTSPRTAPMRP